MNECTTNTPQILKRSHILRLLILSKAQKPREAKRHALVQRRLADRGCLHLQHHARLEVGVHLHLARKHHALPPRLLAAADEWPQLLRQARQLLLAEAAANGADGAELRVTPPSRLHLLLLVPHRAQERAEGVSALSFARLRAHHHHVHRVAALLQVVRLQLHPVLYS